MQKRTGYSVRVDVDLLDKASQLAPDLSNQPTYRPMTTLLGPLSRADVIRLALALGVEQLEREAGRSR